MAAPLVNRAVAAARDHGARRAGAARKAVAAPQVLADAHRGPTRAARDLTGVDATTGAQDRDEVVPSGARRGH